MTQETEVLSGLISQIYDAALDSDLWIEALAGISEFTEGRAAALLSKDTISKSGTTHFHHGVEPYYMRLYAETYMKLAPATMTNFEVGQLVTAPDLMPYGEFLKTRFYQEWLCPQGLVDGANVLLEKSASGCAYFSVLRGKASGMVDDRMRRRMALITPHIRRATLIGKAIDLKRYEAATFADTLDGLSAGLCLVDAAGRIVHANAAGHAIFEAGDVLCATGGRLMARDAQIDRTLRDIFAAAGQGDAVLGIKGIAVPLSSSPTEVWLAHILPLTSGARRNAGIAYSAVAAVFVRKASTEAPSSIETMARLYKLTPSELRVLATLSGADGVSSVATTLGVSAATVKTHLHHLFHKTGASRQTDLVKLVAAHASPLGRP